MRAHCIWLLFLSALPSPAQIVGVELADDEARTVLARFITSQNGISMICGEIISGLEIDLPKNTISMPGTTKKVVIAVPDPGRPELNILEPDPSGGKRILVEDRIASIERKQCKDKGYHLVMPHQNCSGLRNEYLRKMEEAEAARGRLKVLKAGTPEFSLAQRALAGHLDGVALWCRSTLFPTAAAKIEKENAAEMQRFGVVASKSRLETATKAIKNWAVPESLVEKTSDFKTAAGKPLKWHGRESQHMRVIATTEIDKSQLELAAKFGERVLEGYRSTFIDPYLAQDDDDPISETIMWEFMVCPADEALMVKIYESYYLQRFGEPRDRTIKLPGHGARHVDGAEYMHLMRHQAGFDIQGWMAHELGHSLADQHFNRGKGGGVPAWIEEGFGYWISFEYLSRNTISCFAFSMPGYAREADKEGVKVLELGLRGAFNNLAVTKGPPVSDMLRLKLVEMEARELAKSWSVIDFLTTSANRKRMVPLLKAACAATDKDGRMDIEKFRDACKVAFPQPDGIDVYVGLDTLWKKFAQSTQKSDKKKGRLMRASASVLLLSILGLAGSHAAPDHATRQRSETRPSDKAPFAEKYLKAGIECESAGKLDLARENFQLVLERSPRHIPGLVALARVEHALKLPDPAAYHARRALEAFDSLVAPAADEKALRAQALALIDAADPHAKDAAALVGRLPEMLLDDARMYRKRNLDLCALRALERLRTIRGDTGGIGQLIDDLRHKGGDDVAVEDTLGGQDPLKGVSAAWIEKSDAEHALWENAWVRETEHYTVRTNAGYEILETVALAIEPLHRFYRAFYHVPAKDKIRRIDVQVFADHAAFVAQAPEDLKTSLGYFAGTKIVTYDPRPTGGSIGVLIETLAHEASHQFTALVSRGWQPPWMNEGTASYFEGTALLSNRSVRMNLVPRYSMRLETFIFHRKTPERFSLRTLLTTEHGLANYTGTHYAYGWALIWFLWNYEDDNGDCPFRARLVAMMTQGWKEAQAPDSHVKDFETNVVKASKVPGVTDLASFEALWQRTLDDLYQVHTGAIDPTARDLAKARALSSSKHRKSALHLYDRVLLRKQEPDALYESAVLDVEAGAAAMAADRFERFLELTEGTVDKKDKRVEHATFEVTKVDTEFLRRSKYESEVFDRHLALAAAWEKEGFGMSALWCLERARVFGRQLATLDERTKNVRASTGASLATWKLLFNERDIREWTYSENSDNTYRVEGEDLVSAFTETTTGPATGIIHYRLLFSRDPAKGDYTFSARMTPDEGGCELLGACFGIRGEGDFHAVILFPKMATIDLAAHTGEDWSLIERRTIDAAPIRTWFDLVMSIRGPDLEVTINGRPALKHTMPEGKTRGSFGLIMGNGKARFRNLRVLQPETGK